VDLAFSKIKEFSRGHFRTKVGMSLEWPFIVLQELVPKDGIRLLDWLSAWIFKNRLKMISAVTPILVVYFNY